MKLPFLNRKGESQTPERKESKETCSHPAQFQVQLKEDPRHPDLVTSVKCTKCGRVL
jgi:hypothetical protein